MDLNNMKKLINNFVLDEIYKDVSNGVIPTPYNIIYEMKSDILVIRDMVYTDEKKKSKKMRFAITRKYDNPIVVAGRN